MNIKIYLRLKHNRDFGHREISITDLHLTGDLLLLEESINAGFEIFRVVNNGIVTYDVGRV